MIASLGSAQNARVFSPRITSVGRDLFEVRFLVRRLVQMRMASSTRRAFIGNWPNSSEVFMVTSMLRQIIRSWPSVCITTVEHCIFDFDEQSGQAAALRGRHFDQFVR
jgi:hypothetical protein